MRRVLKLAPLLAAAIVLGSPRPAPSQPRPAERIVFSAGSLANLDVFVLEDGPVERSRNRRPIPVTRLTATSERESRPLWSPDGTMVAAERPDPDGVPKVVVMTAPVSPVDTADDALKTGTPEERGVFDGDCPSWSPDSKQIAVARGGSIVVRTIEGGAERTLALGSCPRWSPQGNTIVANQESTKIVAMDVATGASRVIHEEPNAVLGNKELSADGSRLAFGFSSTTGVAGLAVIDRDGGSRRVLAETPPSEPIGVIRWHPDGQSIAYNTESSLGGSVTKIFTVPVAGGTARVVADTPRRGDLLGGWNRGGTRLVFESFSANPAVDPDTRSYVMVVEPGGPPQRIAEGMTPAFSPVGAADPTSSPGPTTGPPVAAPTAAAGEPGLALAHDRGVPVIAAALQNPDDISTDVADIARSLALAAAMILLVVFPSVLFNNTVEQHSDEIRGWFRFGRAPRQRSGRRFTRTWAGFVAFTVVTALLYGFLDPSFGFDKASLNMFVVLLVSLVVLTFILTVPGRRYMVKNHEDRGTIRVVPGTLAVAAVCVLVSRLAGFYPGYLYGAIAGFVFAKELSEQEEGRQAARAALWMLILSVGAWFARMPLADSVAKEDPGLGVLVLDSLLAAIFVAGIEGVVFGMIPLRFLAGEKLFAWNKALWAALFGAGAFLFLHVLLDPESEYLADPNSVPTTIIFVFFAAFGLLSVAFWGYFRFRKEREPSEAT